MEGNLTPSAAPLADLCALLGITTDNLAAVEAATQLAHTFPVTAADAARLDPASVRAFTDHFGDTGRVELRTGALTEIVLTAGVADSEVTSFAARAVAGGPYEAVVAVDKTRLAARLAGASPAREVRLFLFADALRRALARGVARFEADVWPHAPAPLVIAVADTTVELTGPHLSVLGGEALARVAAAAAEPATGPGLAPLVAARDRHIGWDTPWTAALTPWHFELAGACTDPALHALLRAQLVKLTVLYTCDRARAEVRSVPPATIRAEYRGREHLAVITVDERLPLDVTDAETTALLRMVDWCYRSAGASGEPDWVSDRLPFVQTRIAQILEPHPEPGRLVALVRSVPFLLEGIEWHWKAFIEGKVGEYLTQVQQVETVVADTTTGFADRTVALAKSVTDTILAAVAVLIGSFIAAAFKAPFDATLFRIGVRTYAAYVLLFPGFLGLLAAHHALKAARAGFDSRVRRFKETLYSGKVDEIVDQRVSGAQTTFYRWLAAAAVIYVAVSIGAWIAGDALPDRVLRDPSTPTSTPGPSPSGPHATPPTTAVPAPSTSTAAGG